MSSKSPVYSRSEAVGGQTSSPGDAVVVVGAGSGGCHVTHELASAGRDVILVEAGRENIQLENNQWWRGKYGAPAARYWWHWPLPVRNRAVRFMVFGGRVLGGTSSVNGMMYTQGHPQDFPVPAADAEAGLAALGLPKLRWTPRLRHLPPALKGLVSAFHSAGVPWIGRHGLGPVRHGLGFMAGWKKRTSAFYETFGMGRNRSRPEVKGVRMLRGAQVRRILWSDDARTPVVRGVEVVFPDNQSETVPARRVVLAAGAVGTPSILLASGVPRRCNVSVGSLQEHVGFEGSLRLKASCTLGGDPGDDGAWAANLIDSGVAVLTAFLGGYRPEVQISLIPACCRQGGGTLCIRLNVILLRGLSRGQVLRAEAADGETGAPLKARLIFDIHRGDLETLANAFEFLQHKVVTASELKPWYPRLLFDGGQQIANRGGLVRGIEDALHTYNHVTGTTGDALDSRLRLRGCRGVHVADASAFPFSVTGHP
eukprot:CAMPEP_0117521818 /NCGR_PEP_ID=MMETSP0784-20121206/33884_1 /TAXON_ID=39447 /ORGANISM="" /LENGTH=482 /DNA_ID=CAMNT_0005317863 /DNA_START=95 /DNA_END=1539 /DNA_ORIENTATION=+